MIPTTLPSTRTWIGKLWHWSDSIVSRTFCQHFFVEVEARVTKKPMYNTLHLWARQVNYEANKIITGHIGIWGRPRDVVQGRVTNEKPSKCFPKDPWASKQKWNKVRYHDMWIRLQNERKLASAAMSCHDLYKWLDKWESEASLIIIPPMSTIQLLGRRSADPGCGTWTFPWEFDKRSKTKISVRRRRQFTDRESKWVKPENRGEYRYRLMSATT